MIMKKIGYFIAVAFIACFAWYVTQMPQKDLPKDPPSNHVENKKDDVEKNDVPSHGKNENEEVELSNPVQVSDLEVYPFYQRLCDVNSQMGLDLNFDELSHMGETSQDSPYDSYCTTLGTYGHSALITLFANEDGYVSKITISAKYGDHDSNEFFNYAIADVLLVLGFNRSECDTSADQLSEDGHANIWVSSVNRRMVLDYFIERDIIQELRITAKDR